MKAAIMLTLAALGCASMWQYVSRILVQHQKNEAAAYGIPRGNLSDLYPVWLGTRELLLHGKDPYGSEVTRQIQAGYYGRTIEPSRPQDPTNRQAFAYPVYVAFLIAPTVMMPFSEVQDLFRWLLILLTATSVLVWLRALRWQASCTTSTILIFLTLGTFAAVQGVRLQQLSLLVAALIAGSVALLVKGHLASSGLLLALAMIKPQLALPVAAWLVLWACARLRPRWPFLASYLACFMVLIAGGEFLLPDWISKFRGAITAYRQYATSGSLLEQMLTPAAGLVLAAMVVAATAAVCWRHRRCAAQDERFIRLTCVVLAITVLILPMFPPHYQLLLLPGVCLLVRDWRVVWSAVLARALLLLSAAFLLWQWVSASALVISSFFGAGERFWELPLWTNMLLPIPLAACLGLLLHRKRAEQPEQMATNH